MHIADIHLGKSLYGSSDRTDDFFYALYDVLKKYAVDEKVKFVLIAGDFFDVRKISSTAMNHAITCLRLLQDTKIPAIAIEGNHDSHDNFGMSWLQSMSQWEYIKLLEPEFHEHGKVNLSEWDEEVKRGSFIDVGNVRIFGNTWYGSTTKDVLTKIIDALRDQHDASKFNIMMLHTDIEGMIHKNIKGLNLEKLRELKKYVDYLALGHIHQNFVIDGWAHSPGSLECAAINEIENIRGAYLVTVDTKTKKFKAELKREYRQRPIQRLKFFVDAEDSPEDFQTKISEFLEKEISPSDELSSIIEITLEGSLNFKASMLNLNPLKEEIKNKYNPLLVLIKNHTIPVDISVKVDDTLSRSEKEANIITDLVRKDIRFKERATKIAAIVVEAKRLALSGEKPDKIAEMIETNL